MSPIIKARYAKSILCMLGLVLLINLGYAEPNTLAKTKNNLKQLEGKIVQLRQTLSRAHDKRGLLNKELAHTETQIGENQRQLQKIQQVVNNKQAEINTLQKQVNTLSEQLHSQQSLLAEHIRARYKMGEYQPLKWLLNQDKPYAINRLLTYYQYLMRSNQQVMDAVNATQKTLAINQTKLNQDMLEQRHLQQQLQQKMQQFNHDKQYHAALIRSLNQDIQTKQQTLETYRRNQVNLSHLLTSLVRQSVIQTRHPFTQMRKKLLKPVATDQMQKINHGLIFYAEEGTPVHAVFPGKVVFCDWLNGYGQLLILDHGWGFMTLYANNQALFKRNGDTVNQGEKIASVGHSGGIKENGLYFEIRQRGKVIPPLEWLSKGSLPRS